MAVTTPKNILKQSILLFFSFLCISFFSSATLDEPPVLSWETLSDVKFKEKYDKENQIYWLSPTFGKLAKSYEDKVVILEGYFIPIDLESNFHVLSRHPYASCFFCGGASPASVVELEIEKKSARRLRMDQRIRVQGKLFLNSDSYDHCTYILKEATPIK